MPEPTAKDIARKVQVCVIDGNQRHRDSICQALNSFYQVRVFDDAERAMAELRDTPPAVVIVDEEIPPVGGWKLSERISADDILARVPLIYTTQFADSDFSKHARAKGRDALVKPFRRSALLNAISSQINQGVESAWDNIEPVQRSALKQTVSMFNGISDLIDEGAPLPYDDVKESCAPLVEAVSSHSFKDVLKGVRGHDNYSYVHSLRVATFLSLFGHTIGIRGDDLLTLSTGGLVHDVGKMSIPHDVLNKPGRLEGDDWETMKSHVGRTIDFLHNNATIPKGVITIAEQHHEKLDGTGYPNGLKGGELNELARMASIVDIFGALTDRRVYKDPMAPEKALGIMGGLKDEVDQSLLALFREMLLDAASGLETT